MEITNERYDNLLNNALCWIWEHMYFQTGNQFEEFKEVILKNYIGMTEEEAENFI